MPLWSLERRSRATEAGAGAAEEVARYMLARPQRLPGRVQASAVLVMYSSHLHGMCLLGGASASDTQGGAQYSTAQPNAVSAESQVDI